MIAAAASFLIAVACFSAVARAADPVANVSIDPPVPAAGATFMIQITVEGSHDALPPKLPSGAGFDVTGGPSTQQSFSSFNGRTSLSLSFVYTARAKTAGEYTIPPISVTADGKVVKTAEMKFRVRA